MVAAKSGVPRWELECLDAPRQRKGTVFPETYLPEDQRLHQRPQQKVSRAETADLCYTCPPQIQLEFCQFCHHPLPELKRGCADCHNPHGSVNDQLLNTAQLVNFISTTSGWVERVAPRPGLKVLKVGIFSGSDIAVATRVIK